jgi:hypothetical protein
MNSASLCSLAGRYDNPIPTRCLAPIYCLKIPALLFVHPNLKIYQYSNNISDVFSKDSVIFVMSSLAVLLRPVINNDELVLASGVSMTVVSNYTDG